MGRETRIKPPGQARISLTIDDVDIERRIVHAYDRTGGFIQATFHDVDDMLPIPHPDDTWIAERISWDSWRLSSRVTSPEEVGALPNLNPGDRYIGAKGNICLGSATLIDNDPVDDLEVVNKGWIEAYVDARIAEVSSGGPWLVTDTKISAYTVDLLTDDVVPFDSTGGSFTITLPSGGASGQWVIIKDIGGDAEGNPITIETEGSELIDGLSSFTIDGNLDSFLFWFDGTNYHVS